MEIRKYNESDVPAMVRIWNEVVEEGVAFPQEEFLDGESGSAFFAAQSYCGVAVADGRVVGLYILHPNNIGRCARYGQTTTYGDIARQLAEKQGLARMSAQAVGGAVGHNKISIIIPCHRVVGTNGSLTGYAGGIHKKEQLLELEGADMRRFFLPKKGTAL